MNANAAMFLSNALMAIQARRAKSHLWEIIRRFHTIKRRRLRTVMSLIAYIEQEKRRTKIPPAPEAAPKRIWVLQRDQYMFEELLAGNLPEQTWYQNFHVSRKSFFKICDVVRSELARQDTNMRPSVSLEKRVAVALNRLATGSCYTTCGIGFGLPKSTANVVKNEFCDILRRKAASFIAFPKSAGEVRKVIAEFEHVSIFPHVAGALDSTHIRIISPKQNKYDFLGKKNFYSVLVLGVADSNCKFTHVSAYPGAVSHAEMLRDSALRRDIENGTLLNAPARMINGVEVKPLLVGNSYFQLDRWLMNPFVQGPNFTSSQSTFNEALSSAREKIVQSFGMLLGRWRCLQETLKEDTFRVPTTIIACCVLHNLCIDVDDDFPIEQFAFPEDVEFPDDACVDLASNDDGKQVREAIKNHLDSYGY